MKCHEVTCSRERVGNSKYCASHRAEAKIRFRQMIADKSRERAARDAEFAELIRSAQAEGKAAGDAAQPREMIVQEHASPIDNSSPVTCEWRVPDGPCGYAWVNVKPGNSAFAKFLTRIGIARSDSYYGGVTIWISEHNQSLERKTAHAQALAKVLSDNGIRAHAYSRID